MKKNAPFYEDMKRQPKSFVYREPKIQVSFTEGARVDIKGFSDEIFKVEFWEGENLSYSTLIGTGQFAMTAKKFFVNWKVKIFNTNTNALVKEVTVELKDKNVHVFLDSSSLGDTLAWVPQVENFRKITGCKVQLTTFMNHLFEKQYPEIVWNVPGTALQPFEYSYKIGYHLGENAWQHTPTDPRTISLGKIPCEILGIPYTETRPLLKSGFLKPILGKYVCIATMSTAGAKLWQRENGWQEVVDYLVSNGVKVAVIQKEKTSLNHVIDLTGDLSLEDRMQALEHCEFFIGLGSGLSWLAWGMKKPVILISGFSDAFSEFQLDCERVIVKDVCNSCWNDTSFVFDKGDWNWCPRNKNTERQFECTKSITSQRVIDSVCKLLNSST